MPSKTTTRRRKTTGETTGSADPGGRHTEYLPLGTLKADPRNPKAHDLVTIDASVGRFGIIDPIVRDDRTGRLISGHGRVEALRAMYERGEAPPDGVRSPDEDEAGDWLVPVTVGWSSRTDAEARAALVALNRTTELGGWVDEELLGLLDELSEQGEEALVGVGFGYDDVDDLRARMDELGEEEEESESGRFGEDGTADTPSLKEYAERYAEQGRRLVVLDYSAEEYPDVVNRLRTLRAETGADSNAEAVRTYLIENVQPAEEAK